MSHHHHHHHSGSRRKVALILAASLLLAVAAWVEHALALPTWQLLLVYLVPYLLVGSSTLREAAEGIVHGRVFNEDFLMAVATIGALAIGFMPGADTEFAEAVFVMLFFQVGELFEGYAEGRSRDSIAHLVEVRPDTAHVERRGAVETVAPDEVAVGETIVVSPGERVPLDGVILSGQASLNTVALTGESMPRDVGEGDEIVSGCINLSGVLRVRTIRSFGESTVSRIIHLVESANEQKSRSESFISRFARVYTPIVVISAVMLAVVPPLFLGGMAVFAQWLHRALIFLVVSCPCALVISVPLTFFGGLGGASRRGILIKGSNYMDTLARLHTVVFDKTGTLTLPAADAADSDDVSRRENLKPHAREAIAQLKSQGIDIYMMSGDRDEAVAYWAKQAGIDHWRSRVMPQDKQDMVARLQAESRHVAMVGDGINDSQALAAADVGIAMGRGTDVAMDVAQVTLMGNDLRRIAEAFSLSRQTVGMIRQNLFWAFIYNLVCIPLAAGVLYAVTDFQITPMWASALMAMSSVSVVINSLRLKWKRA